VGISGGRLRGESHGHAHSPAYGKEDRWIDSFDLLTTNGRLPTCTPSSSERSTVRVDARAARLSCVIGGLSYLGAVVTITYSMLSVGQTTSRIGIQANVRKLRAFEDLATDLAPTTRRGFDRALIATANAAPPQCRSLPFGRAERGTCRPRK
jgi:hypothetical protein